MKDNLERLVGYLLLIGVITAVIFFGVLTLHFFEELHHINESFFSKHGIDGVITIVLESFMIILLAVLLYLNKGSWGSSFVYDNVSELCSETVFL